MMHETPGDLDAEAADLFDAYLAQLKKQRTWVESDMAQLVSCVRARQRARVLFSAADAEPFIEGSQGQRVINKLFSEATKAEDHALKLEGALLLTAYQREKAGLTQEE